MDFGVGMSNGPHWFGCADGNRTCDPTDVARSPKPSPVQGEGLIVVLVGLDIRSWRCLGGDGGDERNNPGSDDR